MSPEPADDVARALSVELPPALDGERVDRVVAMLTELSRTEASRLVQDGAVRVDGEVVTRGADRLEAGASLTVDLPPDAPDAMPVPEPPLGLRSDEQHPPVAIEVALLNQVPGDRLRCGGERGQRQPLLPGPLPHPAFHRVP